MHDVIIVGGGPAGLTAAIYARRNGRSVLLLEKEGFGGQIAYSPRVDNYPGVPYVSGAELADQMLSQVLALDTDTDIGTVCAVREEDGKKVVLTQEGDRYEGRCVIIAAGARHRQLGLSGEEDLVGRGVSYCAVCDGGFYAGADVAVAGGGDSALQEALLLSDICRTVYVIHRRDAFRGEKALQDQLRGKKNVVFRMGFVPQAFLSADGLLTGLVIREKETGAEESLPLSAVFVAVGSDPQTDAFSALLGLSGAAYLPASEDGATGLPGLFAAGDCRVKGLRQLATAVGDGACAGMAAARYAEAARRKEA